MFKELSFNMYRFARFGIVDSPLLSLGARKSIGKTLTFMRLKGQNVVRQCVIPANPRTAAQQQQRGYAAKAVEDWHLIGMSLDDIAAYNAWATASFRKLSGYNLFTRERIFWYQTGIDPSMAIDVFVDMVTTSGANIEISLPAGNTAKVYMGVSPTSQPVDSIATDNADGTFTAAVSGLASGVKYYFYVLFTDVGGAQSMRTGIYNFTTS